MVAWNPDVPNPSEATPRWGGDSKPISQPQANTSMEKLFSGIGDSLEAVVKGTDTLFKKAIDDDVYKRLDAEREGYTGALEMSNAAANPRADNPPYNADRQVPGDIDRQVNYLTNIKNGMESGKVNDTYYKARLSAIAKDLRATYPGYRDYIDRKISSVVGFDPANSLVSDLLADINTIAAGSSKGEIGKQVSTGIINDYRNVVNDHDADPDTRGQASRELSLFINGQMTPEQAYDSLSRLRASRYEGADIARQAKMAKDGSEIQTLKVGQNFDFIANRKVQNLFTTIKQTTGMYTPEQIDAKMRVWRSGKEQPKPEEITAMVHSLEQAERDITKTLWDEANTTPYANGRTAMDVLGSAEVNKRIDAQLTQVRAFKSQLREGKLTMAGITAQRVNDLADTQVQNILSRPEIRDPMVRMMGLERFTGDKSPFTAKIAEQTVAQQFLGPVREYLLATTESAAVNTIHPNPAGPITLTDTVQGAKAAKVPVPTTANEALKNITYIVDSGIDPKIKQGFVEYFYSPKNLGILNQFEKSQVDEQGREKPGRNSIFRSLTSPAVINEAYSVTRDRPELWGQVKNWATQSFNEMVGTDMRDLGQVQLPVGAGLVYEDKNHSFKVLYKGKDITLSPTGAYQTLTSRDAEGNVQSFNSSSLDTARRAVNRVNMWLSNMSNIAKKDGEDVNTYLMQAMMASGYQPNLGNTTGFTDQMINSIRSLAVRQKLQQQRNER